MKTYQEMLEKDLGFTSGTDVLVKKLEEILGTATDEIIEALLSYLCNPKLIQRTFGIANVGKVKAIHTGKRETTLKGMKSLGLTVVGNGLINIAKYIKEVKSQ